MSTWPAIQRFALCPGPQDTVDVAFLGTQLSEPVAQYINLHGELVACGAGLQPDQGQPAVATGAGGFRRARSAARASIPFFPAIIQPSKRKAPGGSMASRNPG